MPALARPSTLAEALTLLNGADNARPLAGGTALMLMLRTGLLETDLVVSLDRVNELASTRVDSDGIHLGATLPLQQAAAHPAVVSLTPALAETYRLVANHRIRHRATVGGNLAEADYASDPPSVLASMGASVLVARRGGERRVAIDQLYRGHYETVLAPDELIVELVVPVPVPTARLRYLKLITRSSEDRPCVGVAAYIEVDERMACHAVRVVVAASTATPFLIGSLSEELAGKRADTELCATVADRYAAEIDCLGDVRGSAAYRKRAVSALVRRALLEAIHGESGAVRL